MRLPAASGRGRRRAALEQAKPAPSTGSITAEPPNSAAAPISSTTAPASATPAACPMNRQDANQATAVPRADGTIWVALVCKVACSR